MAVSEASAEVVRWIGVKADGRTPLATLRSQARSIDPRMTELNVIEVVRHLCDEGMLAIG
jgi:hypothetical protein